MKEKTIKKIKRAQERENEAIGWGAIFIWWGITEMVSALPTGTGALGFGLILLGLNAARYFSGLSTSYFLTATGILAVLWGSLKLAGLFLNLTFEIPVFAILLLALGVMILARAIRSSRNESIGEL